MDISFPGVKTSFGDKIGIYVRLQIKLNSMNECVPSS